ncbi:MAG: ABC transporter substrate-binding protein [Clostridia bacterium]|nr:ABC transporter substrate-binding protein [Clostridia bacterium]
MKRITAVILIIAAFAALLSGCAAESEKTEAFDSLKLTGSMETDYARQFSIDYYEGGYKLITLGDGSRYLIVPEGRELPSGLPEDISPLYQPINRIYLAATAAMCLFDALDSLDAIRLSGTKEDGWYIKNAREAMADGRIIYAGKYSEPDYELLLSEGCPLAVESLMIDHAADVKDKLSELGITVFTDQSSLEEHPLGRTEWIKVYAAMLDREERAFEVFDAQKEYFKKAESGEKTGETVAFFYISSSGSAVVRKSGDYISKMIELAGGEYVFRDMGDPDTKTSTLTVEMETFFAAAKDADYIIYNSAIDGEMSSMAELIDKSALLGEFKAVKDGNVWCTNKNMYQETTRLGEMTESFRMIFSGEADSLDRVPFLYRLK